MRFKTSYLLISLCCIVAFIFAIKTFNTTSRKNHNTVGDANKIENVVLIIACSLRADHLSCYGYERETSPTIDTLAKGGVFFKNCFVQAPFTVHSVPCIMTSQPPRTLFGTDKFLKTIPDQAKTFADIFKENGFSTLGFMANPWVSKPYNFHKGFDYFYDTSDMLQKYKTEKERMANRVWGQELTEEVIAKVRESKGKFFVQAFYIDNHAPYVSFPPFAGRFTADTSKNHIINLYDETILCLDHHIDTLLKALKDLDLFENTLIVFTTDHGEAFGAYHEYDRGHGAFLYDTVIKSPLIFYNPNLPRKGITVEDYVTSMDILPTSLDVMGIQYDEGQFEGTSLKGFLSGVAHLKNANRHIFSETNFRRKDVRRSCIIWDQRWKLIHNYETIVGKKGSERQLPLFELYDLKNDPHEVKTLHEKNDFTGKLTTLLHEWQKRHPPMPSEDTKDKEDSTEKLPPELVNQLKTLGYLE